jgi:sulfonate transport system permease protein
LSTSFESIALSRTTGIGHQVASLLRAALLNRYFLYGISLAGFLLFWDWAAIHSSIAKFLPRPMEVLHQLILMTGDTLAGKTLWGHLWASFRRVLIGFCIASVIGIPLGLFMALNRYVRSIVKPVFDIFKPMPPISWISLAILWFGIGEQSKIFIIAIGAFVPAVINSFNGIRLLDPSLYDVVRMSGGTRRHEIFEVALPASFPAVFAGLQIALSNAWGCLLAAELVSARAGMGFLIILGMTVSKPAMIIGGMVVIALTAWLLTVVLSRVERIICPWKRELQL